MAGSIGQEEEEALQNTIEPTTKVRPQPSEYVLLYDPDTGNRYLARGDADGLQVVAKGETAGGVRVVIQVDADGKLMSTF